MESSSSVASTSALPAPESRPLGRVATLLLVGWGVAVSTGMLLAAQHAAAPGPSGTPPPSWPAAAGLTPASDRATLLVFAHPRCPCSRATIAELGRLLGRTGGALDARVLLYRPAGTSPSWAGGELWQKAAAIPGVRVEGDEDGREAKRFDAVTSGTTLLYDRDGVLRFHGGLTPARGHEGDSTGADAIARWVTSGAPPTRSPVFGCAIWDDARIDNSDWRAPWTL